MEKLKNLKSVTLYFLLTSSLISSCQNVPSENSIEKKNLVDDVILVLPDKETFRIEYKNRKLLEGNLWDQNRVSVLMIPINDSIAEKLTFSNSRVLSSRKQVKLIKGTYIEHGFSQHFNEKGKLSHVYEYKNGILDGEFISYFENGIVESRGSYKNGDKQSVWEFYNDKGQLIKKEKL